MSEIHGAVGSYVVNALDPDELDEFEAHLAVCPTCSREVQEFGETVAELSLLASVTPPAELRGSILAAVSQVRPLPPEPLAELAPVEAEAPSATPLSQRPVDELALRRQQRRTRVLSVLVAAVMAAALALGGVVYGLVQSRQAQVAQQTAATELLTAPDVRTYSTTMKDGGQISFVVSKSLNRAMFVGKDLPAVGNDKRYQLWTLEGQLRLPTTWWPAAVIVSSSSARASVASRDWRSASRTPDGAQQPDPATIQAVTEL